MMVGLCSIDHGGIIEFAICKVRELGVGLFEIHAVFRSYPL